MSNDHHPLLPTPLSHKDVEVIERKTSFAGFFRVDTLTLRHRRFDGQWLGPFNRELFERGEAVCVLLYDPAQDCVVLTEQFRAGALEDPRSPWLLELVAGMVEPGESYEDVARRESEEEAGCVPAELIPLYRYWVSPGGTSERIQIYCALIDSTSLDGIHGLADEHEDIRLVKLGRPQAITAMNEGIINNAATIIALQWLALNKAQLTQPSMG